MRNKEGGERDSSFSSLLKGKEKKEGVNATTQSPTTSQKRLKERKGTKLESCLSFLVWKQKKRRGSLSLKKRERQSCHSFRSFPKNAQGKEGGKKKIVLLTIPKGKRGGVRSFPFPFPFLFQGEKKGDGKGKGRTCLPEPRMARKNKGKRERKRKRTLPILVCFQP